MYLPTISANEFLGNCRNGVSMLATAGVAGLVTFGVDKGLYAIAQKIFNAETFQRNEKYISYTVKAVAVISGIAVGCLIAPKVFLIQLTVRKIFEAMAFGLLVGAVCKLIENRTRHVSRNSLVYSRPVRPSRKSKMIFAFAVASAAVSLGGVPVLRLGAVVGALVGSIFRKRANFFKDNVINQHVIDQDTINHDVRLTGHRAMFIPE